MKYCRFCGKIIDDNSKFCTHCGKAQTTQGSKTAFEAMDGSASRIIKVTIGCIQRMYTKIQMHKFNSNSKVWSVIKKWSKRVVVLTFVIIAFGLIVLLGFWLYGIHQTSKWNKEDERRETIALKNISKADDIAREFFEEDANHSHKCDGYLSYSCDFDHIDRGIKILINAAEKGDAKAQFTLGCIYAGALYYHKETDLHEDRIRFMMGREINDESEGISIYNWPTMMDTKINYEKAAYWWYQAAIQGNASAMEFLANAYRYGRGVEKNLCKATELMKVAAEKDNSWAQLNYGDMFRDGDVWIKIDSVSINGDYFVIRVKPNIKKAKEWWKKALENGNDSAKERLEKIYE